MLRALHGAPEDMASWLDPARVEDNGLESAKDDKFKSLREELVTTLAERSVSCIIRSSARRCSGFCEGQPIQQGNIWRLKRRVLVSKYVRGECTHAIYGHSRMTEGGGG